MKIHAHTYKIKIMTNKKILSAVPHEGTTYVEGMEKELAENLSREQIAYLTEQGAIEGFGAIKSANAENEVEQPRTVANAEKETEQPRTAAQAKPAAKKGK